MKCSRCKVTLGLLVLIAGVATLAADKRPERVGGKNEALDAERIGKAAGASASTTADGVVRLGWARTDVKVTVDGMLLKPFAGLGSWAAFEAAAHGAIMMGDTVVFEDEITPAMDAAFEAGLEVTAMHNPSLLHDPPSIKPRTRRGPGSASWHNFGYHGPARCAEFTPRRRTECSERDHHSSPELAVLGLPRSQRS
jgi:hypothetical protein